MKAASVIVAICTSAKKRKKLKTHTNTERTYIEMTILVVGGGGREHAVVKKLSESARCTKLYAAPGNAGIAAMAECLPIKATDVDGIVAAAKEKKCDLVFVTPDDPLILALTDENAIHKIKGGKALGGIGDLRATEYDATRGAKCL